MDEPRLRFHRRARHSGRSARCHRRGCRARISRSSRMNDDPPPNGLSHAASHPPRSGGREGAQRELMAWHEAARSAAPGGQDGRDPGANLAVIDAITDFLRRLDAISADYSLRARAAAIGPSRSRSRSPKPSRRPIAAGRVPSRLCERSAKRGTRPSRPRRWTSSGRVSARAISPRRSSSRDPRPRPRCRSPGPGDEPPCRARTARAAEWLRDMVARGHRVWIPAISEYEIRRELIRAGKSRGLARLDLLIRDLRYLAITPKAMRRPRRTGAGRSLGIPAAEDASLDADMILAAQALGWPGDYARSSSRRRTSAT